MQTPRIDRRRFTGSALATIAAPAIARAQAFPAKAIRIVVPAAPGGGLDTTARVLAQKGQELLNQTIYVENKPGANWVIGMEHVAKSPPDGYTLLVLSAAGLSINPHIFKGVPGLDEFTPLTLPTKGAFVLLVNPKSPAKTAPEFIALLKANPGKLNHASNSASTLLLSELFKAETKTEFVDVNYRGGAQSVTDTMNGVTDFCFIDLGTAAPFIQQGTLRPLALASMSKYELAPDIPLLADYGVPVSMDGGTALVGPANLPAGIRGTLSDAFRKAIGAPDVRQRFEAMQQAAYGADPDATLKILRDESARWKKLISERDIKIAP